MSVEFIKQENLRSGEIHYRVMIDGKYTGILDRRAWPILSKEYFFWPNDNAAKAGIALREIADKLDEINEHEDPKSELITPAIRKLDLDD